MTQAQLQERIDGLRSEQAERRALFEHGESVDEDDPDGEAEQDDDDDGVFS